MRKMKMRLISAAIFCGCFIGFCSTQAVKYYHENVRSSSGLPQDTCNECLDQISYKPSKSHKKANEGRFSVARIRGKKNELRSISDQSSLTHQN